MIYLVYNIVGDKMIVYVDLIILATIVVNFAFIKTISYFAKEKLHPIRVILGLLISVLSLLLYFLPYKIYFSIRYLVGLIIGSIVFTSKDIKIKIIEIIIFYFLTMAFIGTLFVFKVKSIILMGVSLLYVIILYVIQNYQKVFTKNIVMIKIGNLKIRALFDSGNLSTYEGKPIVFVNKKYLTTDFTKIATINIQTIHESKNMDIYLGPSLIYKNGNADNFTSHFVFYAFIDNFDTLSNHNYDAILNIND